MPQSRGWYKIRTPIKFSTTVEGLEQGMGQGLESSPYLPRTTSRAEGPVLVGLIARNSCAHGGRLTAGCPAFRLSPLTIVSG